MEGTATVQQQHQLAFETSSASPSPQPTSASASHEPSRAATPIESTNNDTNHTDVVMTDASTSAADSSAKSNVTDRKQQKRNKNNDNKTHNQTNPAIRSKPAIKGEDGFKRMNFLFQASTSLALTKNRACVALSRMHLASMKRVAAKLVLRLDPSVKNCICKRCGSMLIPAHSAKVDVRSSGTAEDIRWIKGNSKKRKIVQNQQSGASICATTTKPVPSTSATLTIPSDSSINNPSPTVSTSNQAAAVKSESASNVTPSSAPVAIGATSATVTTSSTDKPSRKRKRKPHSQRKKASAAAAGQSDTTATAPSAVISSASSSNTASSATVPSSSPPSAARDLAESPDSTITEWILDDSANVQYTCLTCGTKKRIHTKQQIPFVEQTTSQ